MIWLLIMCCSRLVIAGTVVSAGVVAALLGVGVAPVRAIPESDDQGYLDSVARCAAPDTAVAFGSTASSRVAICKAPDGSYQYRGVRLRDGARLIAPASLSGGVVFVAENNGISYSVSSSELVVSSGSEVIRRESMIDYHKPGAAPTGTATPTTTAAPVTTPATPTPTTPLPPPLPAEVGGLR